MHERELRASRWNRITDRCLVHARPDKRDARMWFGKHHVPHAGERREHSPHCRIGQHREQRNSLLPHARSAERGLGHLKKSDHALLYARPARRADGNHRPALTPSGVERPGDLFAHHAAHAAAKKPEIENNQDNFDSHHPGATGDDRIEEPGRRLRLGELLVVRGDAVRKMDRVSRPQVPIRFLKGAAIGKLIDSLRGAERRVVAARGADQELVQPGVAADARGRRDRRPGVRDARRRRRHRQRVRAAT